MSSETVSVLLMGKALLMRQHFSRRLMEEMTDSCCLLETLPCLWVFSKRFLLSCVVTEFVLTDIPHFFIETMSLIICCCFMSAVEVSKSAIKIENYLAWNYTNKNFMQLLSTLCKWMNWKINTYFTPANICRPNVPKHCDDKSHFIFKSFALIVNGASGYENWSFSNYGHI